MKYILTLCPYACQRSISSPSFHAIYLLHRTHRDERQVVIANDGSVFPGDSVALTAAQQLHIALKNKAAGPVDPHAGHNH